MAGQDMRKGMASHEMRKVMTGDKIGHSWSPGEIGHSRSQDQKWGRGVHCPLRRVVRSIVRWSFPQWTPYPTLKFCGPSSCWTLINYFFSPLSKGNLWKGILLFSLFCIEFEKTKQHTAVVTAAQMIYVFLSGFGRDQSFSQLQRWPTSQPHFPSWLPWGPNLMNILKNDPLLLCNRKLFKRTMIQQNAQQWSLNHPVLSRISPWTSLSEQFRSICFFL